MALPSLRDVAPLGCELRRSYMQARNKASSAQIHPEGERIAPLGRELTGVSCKRVDRDAECAWPRARPRTQPFAAVGSRRVRGQ